MTHDPDHDSRALNPDLTRTNGLSDRRLDDAYRRANQGPQEEVPWELRGARSAARPSKPVRTGPSTTTRAVIALLLVAALVIPLIARW